MNMTDLLIGGAAGVFLSGGGAWLYNLLMRKDAQSKAELILTDAKRESETRFKESELRIKELELDRKAESEREINKLREGQLVRERELDKRDTVSYTHLTLPTTPYV